MTLDEQILREHIAAGPYQSGFDLNKWQLVSIDWPHVVISITATSHEGWPAAYSFRFECTNYPDTAVTARPWDMEHNSPLEPGKWPGGTERFMKVFNPGWKQEALYLPCDRIAMEGHPDWLIKHAHLTWKPDSNITLYLDAVYELLNSSSYTGPRSA